MKKEYILHNEEEQSRQSCTARKGGGGGEEEGRRRVHGKTGGKIEEGGIHFLEQVKQNADVTHSSMLLWPWHITWFQQCLWR